MKKESRVKLNKYLDNIRVKINNEEAFTLIELIVVMAIIAVLVLLAAPQFMGYTQKAKIANIQNDTAVVAMTVSEGFIMNDSKYTFEEWPDADDDTLIEAIGSENLYGVGGLLEIIDIDNPEDYREVPGFVKSKVKSSLDGTFFSDKDGNVIYLDNNHEKEIIESIEDMMNMLLTDVQMAEWKKAVTSDLDNLANSGLVYGKNGLIGNVTGDWREVPSDMNNTGKDGTYYRNEDGDIIYVESSNTNSGGNNEHALRTPGSSELKAGNENGGVYDEVNSDTFFLNDLTILPKPSSVTNHTPQPWLKLAYDGKTLFLPKQPIGLSNGSSDIYNETEFSHDGVIYKLRLLTNTEWDNIMYPMHERAEELNLGVYLHGLGSGVGKQFTNSDLALGVNGTLISDGGSRGNDSNVANVSSSTNGDYRPVVEVVGYGEIDSGTPDEDGTGESTDYAQEAKELFTNSEWEYDDFRYEGQKLLGFSDKGETKYKDGITISIPDIGGPDGEVITEIANGAFYDSKFSGDFNAPNVQSIENNAFTHSIFTGDFNAPNVESIGFYAFQNGKFTGDFDAPKVITIGGIAFNWSEFTGDFNAPNVQSIGDYAFYRSGFTGEFNAPTDVKVGEDAFAKSKFTNYPR